MPLFKRPQEASQPSSKRSRAKRSQPELRVSQVPSVQFKGQWFDVSVLLLDTDGHLRTDTRTKLARPQLYYSDTKELCEDQNVFEIKIREPQDSTTWPFEMRNGRFSFEARINTLTRDSIARGFCLHVDAKDQDDAIPGFSNEMNIVSHRLAIITNGMESSASATSSLTWYNQMGGGSNCIRLEVECRDATGALCQKSIPLKLTLLYDDDKEPVRTQDILTIQEASQLKTEGGRAIIRVRIEEVSRRHQNRLFALELTSDTAADPLSASVAPVTSPPINVLSKISPRDRRIRQRHAHGAANGAVKGNVKERIPSSVASSTSFSVPSSLSMVLNNGRTRPISNDEDGLLPDDEGKRAIQALGDVLGWIDGTLKCLCDMRWKPVGFEQGPKGPDPTKPLFAMSNPNERIEAQLAEYGATIQTSLSTILQIVEPILEGRADQASPPPPHGGGGDACRPEPLSLNEDGNTDLNGIRMPALERSNTGGSDLDKLVAACEADSGILGCRGFSDLLQEATSRGSQQRQENQDPPSIPPNENEVRV